MVGQCGGVSEWRREDEGRRGRGGEKEVVCVVCVFVRATSQTEWVVCKRMASSFATS